MSRTKDLILCALFAALIVIGFAVASYITGCIANKVTNPGYKRLLAANFTGLVIVYFFGMLYYYLISYFYLKKPYRYLAFIPILLHSCRPG